MCNGRYPMSKRRLYCAHQANRYPLPPRPKVIHTQSDMHVSSISYPKLIYLMSILPLTFHLV
jgi:hypothetical protein